MKLSVAERLNLLKFVCSFVWTDLKVAQAERDLVMRIVGHLNLPSRLAASAALLYAKNLLSLLTLVIDKDTGELKINPDDDIIKGVSLTRAGAVIHPQFAKAA